MSEFVEIDVKYDWGNHTEKWTETDYHCIGCGNKSVWVENEGDFYQGCRNMCVLCGWSFSCEHKTDDKYDKQRMEKITAFKPFKIGEIP